MHEEDRIDYENAVKFLGYTLEQAYTELRRLHSFKTIPLLKTRIDSSEIEGMGVFSTEYIPVGNIIEMALDGPYTTQVGRYVNHSRMPNSKMHIVGKNLYLLSILNIESDSEITIDYRTIRK